MAAINPDYALELARSVGQIYGDAESEMIRKVSRRLARGIDKEGWAERKRAEIGHLKREANEVIRRLEGKGPQAAGEAIERGFETGYRSAKSDLGIKSSFIRTNQEAVRLLAATTSRLISSTHLQIARSSLDIYRGVIVKTSLQGVVTGTMSRREAAQKALDKFARQGITGFIDKSGANWELESYVEMATRTGAGRAMVEGRLEPYKEAGRQLVIVSQSPHPCEFCQPWEGQILSIEGDIPGLDGDLYPTLEEATGSGLFHPN